MIRWAKSATLAVLSSGELAFELVDRIVHYCAACECDQEQLMDLWPECDLGPRELQRTRGSTPHLIEFQVRSIALWRPAAGHGGVEPAHKEEPGQKCVLPIESSIADR